MPEAITILTAITELIQTIYTTIENSKEKNAE